MLVAGAAVGLVAPLAAQASDVINLEGHSCGYFPCEVK